MFTASVYFLGRFRPAYFEGPTARAACDKLRRAIAETPDRQWLAARVASIEAELTRRGYASACAEYGALGVGLRQSPHDAFLDGLTRALPAYPGLDYAEAANA